MSGRSVPSTDRAVVDGRSTPFSITLTTVSAGQSLRSTGDREPGVDSVRYLVRAVGQAVGLDECGLVPDVDAHHTRETGLVRDRLEDLPQRQHR
jgi:hypothetical protein